MANSKLLRNHGSAFFALAAGLFCLCVWPSPANAQQQTQGFAVERFYPSAPGGGWFVMDDVNLSGGLGGTISLTTDYSRNPLEVTSPAGTQQLALVSNEAFVDIGIAVTYDRYRAYLNLPTPVVVTSHSGTLGGYQLTAPSVNLATNPDSISDSRMGFDVRLLGKPASSFRLGASAQLIIPSGSRSDYVTDGTYRGMFRMLTAGDVGRFSYAGQLGVHIRPVQGPFPPGGPNGNEILFGASAGRRFAVSPGWVAVVGPEFYGETAVRSSISQRTGFEGLLTTRFEPVGAGRHLQFKLGIGHGIVQQFGAPEWRILAGVEVFGRRPERGTSSASTR